MKVATFRDGEASRQEAFTTDGRHIADLVLRFELYFGVP